MNLNALFAAFKNLQVLVVGDVILDEYITGTVDRISPEAPVPVLSRSNQWFRLGGAANVAHNIAALGAKPLLYSLVGSDAAGKQLLHLLKEANINAQGINTDPTRITSLKTRILSNNHHLLRMDQEVTHALSQQQQQQLTTQVLAQIPNTQVVLFQDYDKGVLNETCIQEIITCANQHQVPVVVDPKYRNFYAYKQATLFKPNLKELHQALDIDCPPANGHNQQSLAALVKPLRRQLGINQVMVTLSAQGMYMQNETTDWLMPSEARSVVDVSGAGDAVISVVSLCQAQQLAPPAMLRLANIAGGWVCEQAGVVPIQAKALFELAASDPLLKDY